MFDLTKHYLGLDVVGEMFPNSEPKKKRNFQRFFNIYTKIYSKPKALSVGLTFSIDKL